MALTTALLPDAAIDPGAVDTRSTTRPVRKPFVRRSAAVRVAPDVAARQGRVATLAWAALGDREAVAAFLNTFDPELGGRPLDLALANDAGLAAVGIALAARAKLCLGLSENPDRGNAARAHPTD